MLLESQRTNGLRCLQLDIPVPLSRSPFPDAAFERTPFSPLWKWLREEPKRLLSADGVTCRVYW